MKAEITFEQLFWNETDSLLSKQSNKKLDVLFKKAACNCIQLAIVIGNYVEENNIDADSLDKMLCEMSIEEIAEELYIGLKDEEDE